MICALLLVEYKINKTYFPFENKLNRYMKLADSVWQYNVFCLSALFEQMLVKHQSKLSINQVFLNITSCY